MTLIANDPMSPLGSNPTLKNVHNDAIPKGGSDVGGTEQRRGETKLHGPVKGSIPSTTKDARPSGVKSFNGGTV